MSLSQSLTLTWQSPRGAAVAETVSPTGTNEDNRSFTVAGNTTNQAEALAFTQAGLQLIYITSNVALTCKTNSTGAPADTLSIGANVPFAWVTGSGITNPFAGNVTSTFWSNATSGVATVSVRTLSN